MWQTTLMAVVYLTLFAIAVRYLVVLTGRYGERDARLTYWRYLSLAPMLTVVLGSFASLPLILIILALGHL
jgi:hypothetical protein